MRETRENRGERRREGEREEREGIDKNRREIY